MRAEKKAFRPPYASNIIMRIIACRCGGTGSGLDNLALVLRLSLALRLRNYRFASERGPDRWYVIATFPRACFDLSRRGPVVMNTYF